ALLYLLAVAAAALPLGEAPQVAAHPRRVELATDQVHVGAADHAVLVGGERHPLGEHVVGCGEPMAAAVAGEVGELDAVFAEQLPGLGHVGHDRLVRVDEVGVGGARAAVAVDLAPRVAPGYADEAEVPVHAPLLGVDAGAKQLAGALLGAALAAGV